MMLDAAFRHQFRREPETMRVSLPLAAIHMAAGRDWVRAHAPQTVRKLPDRSRGETLASRVSLCCGQLQARDIEPRRIIVHHRSGNSQRQSAAQQSKASKPKEVRRHLYVKHQARERRDDPKATDDSEDLDTHLQPSARTSLLGHLPWLVRLTRAHGDLDPTRRAGMGLARLVFLGLLPWESVTGPKPLHPHFPPVCLATIPVRSRPSVTSYQGLDATPQAKKHGTAGQSPHLSPGLPAQLAHATARAFLDVVLRPVRKLSVSGRPPCHATRERAANPAWSRDHH
ncbi:hypothetical protein VTI74DRAFT_4498 [Chaetomium olivicolor]